MTIAPATLRTNFPEFVDGNRYPDSLVKFWLTVSVSMVNTDRWGELSDLGVQLCTAHHLAMAARDQGTAGAGGLPGQVTGALSSKAVDKVSASYDTSAVTIDDAGFWNMTSYGVRFLSLARMMGAGGLQV